MTRRALVTGGDAGIGAAVALALAEGGADLVIHHHRGAERAEALAGRVRAMGRGCDVLEADFSDPEAAAGVIDAAGAPDVLVANVAVQQVMPWEEVTAEIADWQWRTNFLSSFLQVQRLMPTLARRGWGRIVLIGSVQGVAPHPDLAVYAALKAAQANLVRSLAVAVSGTGVTVNMVSPGLVETDRTAAALAEPGRCEAEGARVPAGRVGLPADVAPMCALLASEAGGFVTGQNVLVDGGASLRGP